MTRTAQGIAADRGNSAPARKAFAITPHDSNDLSDTTRALLAAGSGDIYVNMQDTGTNVKLYIAAGVPLAVAVTRVYSTGTTATGIVGLV